MKNAIEAINPEEVDIYSVQQRRDKFKVYELLETLEDLDEAEDFKAEHDEDAITFEENYFNTASKIERLLTVQGNPNQVQITHVEEHTRDISQMHFSKIAIPKFSGNYEDWYLFYNTFESIIHSNPRLTSIQKFHYLISSLQDNATDVIQSLEINSDNYEEALQLLKQCYDDKRIIAQEHIKAMFDLPVITKGNHNTFRQLIDHV